MKKKGFTLIELLAVIVILAIIALIATPIIMNIIENSKRGAAERSAENYVAAVETAIMGLKTEGTDMTEGVYSLGEIPNVETSGTLPTEANIIVENGVVVDGSTFRINGYLVNIVDGLGESRDYVKELGDIVLPSTKEDIIAQSASTPTVYYNPVENTKCTKGETNCYGWYVLANQSDEHAYITLLMENTLVKKVKWCKTGSDVSCNGDGAKEALASKTSDWRVKATIPSVSDIRAVEESGTLPAWACHDKNDYVGYWTTNVGSPDSNTALIVHTGSKTILHKGVTATDTSVKPMITIPKLHLK